MWQPDTAFLSGLTDTCRQRHDLGLSRQPLGARFGRRGGANGGNAFLSRLYFFRLAEKT